MKTKLWIRVLCFILSMLFVVTTLAACESEPGPQGPTGEAGADGADGLPGLDGNTWTAGAGVPTATANSGDMYLDTLTNNVYQYNGTAWTLIASIQGADGAQGPQGESGTPGTPGTPGEDGTKWHTGNGIPTVINGVVAGDLYLDLTTGDVYKYTTVWGKIGNIKGADGQNGGSGSAGAPGADGNTWTVGEGAPTGTAKNGDMYYDKTNSKVYQYQSTAWVELGSIKGDKGDQGQQGATGAPGADGTKWYTGEGAPTASITDMKAGDIYLDLNTGNVYKYTTTWGEPIGCLKGVAGENGAAGSTGAAGANGNTWTAGEGAPLTAANNGDMYYDQVSGAVYQYQTNGWVLLSKPMTEEEKQLKELLTLKKELRLNEDGSFRVLVISDVQCVTVAGLESSGTIDKITRMIAVEKPNLVLFSGDNAWHIDTEAKFREYIAAMVKPVEDAKIPWAHVYGNHDDEANAWNPIGLPKAKQQKIYESFEYCVSKAGEESLFGVGNYVLPILTHDGSKIAYNVWGLDSGAYAHDIDGDAMIKSEVKDSQGNVLSQYTNYFHGKYEGIKESQVEWYLKTSKLLEDYNGGEAIPAMMYFHVPLQETYTAWKLATMGKHNMKVIGTKGENISAPAINAGLFSAILKRGDVKLIANGHDHNNDFSVEYRGVNLCYCASISYGEGGSYSDSQIEGGRVVDFDGEGNITTRMSYVKDLPSNEPEEPKVDPNAPILNLSINSNSVTNTAEGGPEVVTVNYENSTSSLVFDETLGRYVVTFDGVVEWPDVYTVELPKAMYTSVLSDGFSYEVMFKATAFPSSGYVGIIDMEELGGFGLNLYAGGILYAEVGLGGGWDKWKVSIEKDTWYHCVYVFDGTNTTLYLNGEKVTTDNGGTHEAVSGDYRQPTFTDRAGEEYLCTSVEPICQGQKGYR